MCHEFLAASGYSTCSKCNHIMCSYCQGSIEMDMSMYCLLCAASESLIPELDSPAAEGIENKRRILIEVHDFSGADELDSDEVEDVLDLMRFMKSFKDMECTVPFPLYPSDAMFGNDMLKWNEVVEINFADGGSFIADGSVDQMLIPRILKLFAEVTKFANKDERHTEWKKDSAIFDAVPKMLIDFAQKSRVDSG